MAVLHSFLTKDGIVIKKLTATSAIVQKCLDCCNWNAVNVYNCTCNNCALYPFRSNSIRKLTSVRTKKYYSKKENK